MKLLIPASFFISLLLLYSCLKDPKKCTSPPMAVPIRVVDNNGQDLLNPNNSGSYKINDIEISYIENGETKYSAVALDSLPNTDTFLLATGLSWIADKGRNFFLKLSNTDTDTIYLRNDHVSEDGCSFFRFIEFKYNDVIYNPKGIKVGCPYVFEIIK